LTVTPELLEDLVDDAGPIGPDPLRVGLIIDTGLEGVPAALAELAAFVHACWVRTVPFKATAGLHRAVRAVDERDGLVHHGFLNLLVAYGSCSTSEPREEAGALGLLAGSGS